MVDRIVNIPVTVTVASIKPVQPGKKMGAVYGIDGQRWGVWGNQLDKFVEGGVYKILSHKEGEFQGQVLKTVQEFEYVGAPKPAPQRTAAAPSVPQYAQGGDAENTRRRDIFIAGAYNNAIRAGLVDPFDEVLCVTFVNKQKIVWENTLGPHVKTSTPMVSRNADLNDSIPSFDQ